MKTLLPFFLFALVLHVGAIFLLSRPGKNPSEATYTVRAGVINVEIQEPIPARKIIAPGSSSEKAETKVDAAPVAAATADAGSSSAEATLDGNIQVEYPSLSRKLGEEGETSLELSINERGEVSEVKIVKSSGYERLDESAKKLLERAHFHAPLREGKPVPSVKTLKLKFQLK